jgi:hypothetical protein
LLFSSAVAVAVGVGMFSTRPLSKRGL